MSELATIVTAWESVFGAGVVGPDSDFLELGGRSIHMIKIAIAVSDDIGIDLPMAELFECRTPRQMTDLLASNSRES